MTRLIHLLAFFAFILAVRSNDDRKSTFENDCAVTGVTIQMDSGSLYVFWTPPDSTKCPAAKEYHLNYNIDDEGWIGPLETMTPDASIVRVDIGEIFCEKLMFEVHTLDEAHNILYITEDIPYERNIPTPNVVKAEDVDGKLKIEWDYIWDPAKTNCVVDYTVKYQDQILNTEKNYYEIEAEDLTLCSTHTIEISASSNGYVSVPNTYNYLKNLPSVKIIDSTNDQSSVIFEPLQDTPIECGQISYKIIQRDQKCFKHTYTVIATTDTEYESFENQIETQRGPGPVKDLTVEITGSDIEVNWEPPTDSNNCNVEYEVSNDEDDVVITTHVTNAHFSATLTSCVGKPINVIGIVENVKGEPVTILAYGKIDGVENLKCTLVDNEDVECSWEKPKNSENCDEIQYRLNYYNGDDLKNKITSDLNISLTGIGCQLGWVSVEAFQVVDGVIIDGKSVESNIEGCHSTKLLR